MSTQDLLTVGEAATIRQGGGAEFVTQDASIQPEVAGSRSSTSSATTASGSGVAVANIHTFGINDGGRPRAGLILAPDGKLYGTTWNYGSTVVNGAVYQIDPLTNVLEVLHMFSPLDPNQRNTDGFGPVAPLSAGPDGLLYGTTRQGGLAGPLATSRGVGVLFRLDPADPTTFTTLHNFGTSAGYGDGATPSGAPVSDGHGSYYGATNSGVIYKWDGSSLSTVHAFEPLKPDRTNVEGANPYGSPIFGADGKLYGTTVYGGRNGHGTVYSIDPVSKEFRVIYNFAPDPISLTDNAPLQSLFLASNGTLYGTNEYGGPNGTGFVFKLVANEVTILHEFGIKSAETIPRFSNADGSLPLSTLAEGPDGMIYGTTYYGGANGAGTIFRIAKDGTGFESLYSFVPGHDPVGTGSYPATGLVRMPDGSMIGTTFLGGIGYGVVYRLTLPPSVSIQPAPVIATRTGRGILSRRVSAMVLNGEAPYSYSWSIDFGAFTIHSPGAKDTSISATLAACDSAEGSPSQMRLVGAQAGPPPSHTRPRVPRAGSATNRKPWRSTTASEPRTRFTKSERSRSRSESSA
jgi:uncharacterized repeat protein (TIGR03803 family)